MAALSAEGLRLVTSGRRAKRGVFLFLIFGVISGHAQKLLRCA